MDSSELRKNAMAHAIREHLRRNGIRQVTFAELVGCDPAAVSRYIAASAYPQGHLPNILDILSLTEAEIIRNYRNSIGDTSIDDRLDLLRRFYSFGRRDMSERVNIVTASSGLVSEYKDYTARNYIELDNYADRDAVLQISIDLSRCFPQSEVKLWKSEEFTEQNFGENIVLLGSPSFGKYRNNTVVDSFVKERNIPIYLDDESLNISDEEFRIEVNGDGSVKTDYAVIVRFRNLFVPDKCIISLMGHFSWGVTAAAASLSARALESSFALRRIPLSEDSITVFPIRRAYGRAIPIFDDIRIFDL